MKKKKMSNEGEPAGKTQSLLIRVHLGVVAETGPNLPIW